MTNENDRALARRSARPRIVVYSRAWCHLCDDLLTQLAPLGAEFGASIEVVDLDQHPELEDRYGERIPVLLANNRELCHYFLDAPAVRAYLTEFR